MRFNLLRFSATLVALFACHVPDTPRYPELKVNEQQCVESSGSVKHKDISGSKTTVHTAENKTHSSGRVDNELFSDVLINDPLHWFRLVDVKVIVFNLVLRLWTDDLIRRRLDQPRQIAYDTQAARSPYKDLYLTVQALLVEIHKDFSVYQGLE